MDFQGLLPLTKVMTMQKVKVRGQRSNFSPICVFPDHNPGMILPIWIHGWLWNDTHTLFEEVPYCFSRSFIKLQGHTGWKVNNLLKFEHFQMITVHERLWNDTQSSKRHKCYALLFKSFMHPILRSHRPNKFIRPVKAIKSLRFVLFVNIFEKWTCVIGFLALVY